MGVRSWCWGSTRPKIRWELELGDRSPVANSGYVCPADRERDHSALRQFLPRSLGVSQTIEMVGLTDKANTQTLKLSGGQLQRLSVALALIGDNDIIFLDEPTTGLDPQARHSLWEVIRRMRGEGKTVFMTTHYMDEAEKLCDRVAVVDQGKVIALDSPAGLIQQHFREKAIDSIVRNYWQKRL